MVGPDPVVAQARNAVREALAQVDTAVGPRRVLVACSGGADSLALAATLAFVAPRCSPRWQAGAVIVDHNWFAGSDQVAQRTRSQCAALGLDPVHVVAVQPEAGQGPEAAARTARYAAIDQLAQTDNVAQVLLGHTMTDQAETVLLGLLRGSGTRSLAGMPSRRGRYLRPFLGLQRSDTEQICAALGLTPWRDPSNFDQHFPRVRVRHELLTACEAALGAAVVPALARTAAYAQADADYLDEVARQTAADLVELTAEGIRLPIADLETLPAAIRVRVFAQQLVELGVPADRLTSKHLAAIARFVDHWRGQQSAQLPAGVQAHRKERWLYLDRAGN